MHPIFDDYGHENNNDSYFVEFSSIVINEKNFSYVENNDTFACGS